MLLDILSAVTSGLDFIFCDIQNLANMFSRAQRAKHVCIVSACAPMGTDFGKEMNNWPTSVSAASLWLTCSHAAAFLRTLTRCNFFFFSWSEGPCNSVYKLKILYYDANILSLWVTQNRCEFWHKTDWCIEGEQVLYMYKWHFAVSINPVICFSRWDYDL